MHGHVFWLVGWCGLVCVVGRLGFVVGKGCDEFGHVRCGVGAGSFLLANEEEESDEGEDAEDADYDAGDCAAG